MIPKSIRWQLPLTYVGIALLATLALGGILLTTLRGFYLQDERNYLDSNAEAISVTLTSLSESGIPPEIVESQLENFAFLSQSRVSLLDVDGITIASSSHPDAIDVSFYTAQVGVDPVGGEANFDITTNVFQSFISIIGDSPEPINQSVRVIVTKTIDTSPTGDHNIERSVLISALPVGGTPYGFDLGVDNRNTPRSEIVIRKPYYNTHGTDPDREPAGYVELSEGPAYGRDILEAVTRGWAIAGGIAVLLAAGVGFAISRRISTPLHELTSVTTRMAAGDLSARANRSREDELGLLARSFNEMADRVEETIITLRRFVADAAHELHTPLTALRTNLELAKSDEHIERAQAQVDRLETLVDGLLDLSRVEAHSNDIEYAALDLTALILQTSELYASRAEQGGINFTLDLPQHSIMINANEAQLRRALGNLLDNALKFTPQDGSIRVALKQSDNQVEVWIEDNGISIPEEDLPLLFGRFHRGRNATPYPGSGLGLAIVKAVVEEHGGQVYAENLDQGARFSMRLPTIS